MNLTYHQYTELNGKNQQLSLRHRRLKRKSDKRIQELETADLLLQEKLVAAEEALGAERQKRESIEQSASHRIGRVLTCVPRKVRSLFR
jgi:ribosomal protein L4